MRRASHLKVGGSREVVDFGDANVSEALDIGDPRPGVCNPLGQILHLCLDRLNIRGEGLFLGSQCDDFLGLSLE